MCPAIDQPLQLDAKQLEQAMKSQAITVSELARRSGVSRTAIHGMLRGGRKRVQKRTFDRVAQTLDLRPDQLSGAGALGKYLDWVVRQNAELDFAGFGIVHLDRLPLEDLFVPMEVEESLDAETSGLPEMLAVALGQQARRPAPAGPPRRMETAEAAAGYPRLVLTGAPGSGKTTLARHLAGAAARALAEGKPGKLPLLVRLVEYDRASEELGALDPAGYVAAWVRQDKGIDVEPLLRERLESGACIVLLDGLDEVARDRPGEPLTRRLEEFIRRYPGNQYLLTARQQGFDRGPWSDQGFRHLDLVPWDDGRIGRFVRNWVRATGRVGKGRGAQKEEDRLVERLQSEFRSAPGIRPLTSNPLMLAVLVAMHFAYGALPRRRAEVYAKLVETFLESWEKAKFSARPGDVLCGTRLEGREYGWLLEDLALQMQHNDAAVAPRWWLADQVARFLGEGLGLGQEAAKRECDRVLQYLGDRSGLLVERGPGLFGFSHLTFQEFFAARAMIRQSAGLPGRGVVEALRPYLYHPRWSEVVRLVCAQLPPPQPASLVRSILDDPDPIGRFLHRGPILALRCLGDGAAIADPAVLDQVFSSVHDLGQSRWWGITMEVLVLLENLEGTRFTVDCDGFPVTFYHLARRLKAERPEERLEPAEKVLLSSKADKEPLSRTLAAVGMANALAEGRVAWDPEVASEVGRVLMEMPDPDQGILNALRTLLDARERRAGLRMEGVLAEAMEGFGGAVEVAMVFGSVARLAQDAQSDIDLLVVGEVTLRQLAEPLDRAQTVLGRRINPVVYDPATLRAKYQDGNPFVHDVLRREKVWIKGSDDALGDLLAACA